MIFTDLLTDYAGGDDDEGVDQNSPDSQGSGRFSLAEVSITWFEENQRVRLCCNRGYVRLCCILTPPPDSTVSKEIQRNIRTSKGKHHLESLGKVMDESIKWVGGVFRVH